MSLGTGRSGSGRLRNFKAMSDDKLWNTYSAVVAEGDDSEAREALDAEMARRGFSPATSESDPEAEAREWAEDEVEAHDATSTLSVEDLHRTLEDERHLGFGYACCDVVTGSRAGRLDSAIVYVANELGLSYEDLFHWSNSKYGRWLADGVYGRDESPTRATVRHYLNPEAVRVSQEF